MATRLSDTTRDAWDKTLVNQVLMAMPITNAMMTKRRVSKRGGLTIKKTVTKDTMESLAQDYGANDPLVAQAKDIYETVYFNWKRKQVPILVDGDEEMQNSEPGDHRIIDLVKNVLEQGQKGAKLSLRTSLFEIYSATGDSTVGFQGFDDALHSSSTTYGNLARSTTSNTWWFGASRDASWTDIATAAPINVHTIREMARCSSWYADRKPGDMLVVMSPTNFVKLQDFMETRMLYSAKGNLAKQGFQAMDLDNMEIVADPHLDSTSTLRTKVYLLYLPSWELVLHPKRPFKLTDQIWQGSIINGPDKYLSRVLAYGNCVCWHPNANCLLTNVS